MQQDTQPLGHLALAHADVEHGPPLKRIFVSFEGSNKKTALRDMDSGALKLLFQGQGVHHLHQDLGADEPPQWQTLKKISFVEDGHYIMATLHSPY